MTDPLVGRWFHSFEKAPGDDCELVCWQGEILGSPQPGTYFVQTLEWMMGDTSDAHLVSLDDTAGCAPATAPVSLMGQIRDRTVA